MGMILCKEHGQTGIALVCHDLQDAFDKGLRLPPHEEVIIDFTGRPSDHVCIHLCIRCLSAQGLHPKAVLQDFPEEDLAPLCWKCLQERMQKGGSLNP